VKLVVFASSSAAGASGRLGVLAERGVVPIDQLLSGEEPQAALEQLIDAFETLKPRLEALARDGDALALEDVRLLPPVPRPGKILCTTAVYARLAPPPQQLLMTLKSAESVVGPGELIHLPAVGPDWAFVPQATLGLVIRGPAKRVQADAWWTAIFGYTCAIDVMARGDPQFGRDYWLAKSDTLGPLGPAIVTVDEIADPSTLRVRSWQNGAPAQDFSIADASHTIGEQVELATTVMTLYSGDIVLCGTSPEGQRPLADGDRVEVEIDAVGRLSLTVAAAARSRA
jgi:2-keto-4-pentenoate hydratase/2-oxohepta-3-ene-1,7-dioic acid hydratase in catechol pathway